MNSKGTQPYKHMYPFSSKPPSIQATTEHRAGLHVLYVGPCQLSILNTAVCACPSQTPQLAPSPSTPAPHNHKFILWVCDKTQALWFKLRQRLKN